MTWPGWCLWVEHFSAGILIDSSTNTFPRVNSGPQQLHFLFCLLDMMMWEADTTANTEWVWCLSWHDKGGTPTELSSPHQSSQSPLNVSDFSKVLSPLWKIFLIHWFWTLFWYLIDHQNRKLIFGDLYSYWYTSESSCLAVFVPHCLDILCILSQNHLRNLYAPTSAACRFMTYLLPAICYSSTLPCTISLPALSVTPGCCKSNITKQTSSDKHWRGVSCSIHFSTSCYHIMLLISHADKVRN